MLELEQYPHILQGVGYLYPPEGPQAAWDGSTALQVQAILDGAFDIVEVAEINGEESLTFSIRCDDPKRKLIQPEVYIAIPSSNYKRYRVRTITDTDDSHGRFSEVYCEGMINDLAYVRVEPRKFENALPKSCIEYALKPAPLWTFGTTDMAGKTDAKTWESKSTNVLALLREIQGVYGGDLFVGNAKRQIKNMMKFTNLLAAVSLVKDRGNYNSERFATMYLKGKNLEKITAVTDSTDLVTRVYAVGNNGLKLDYNGKDYVEDTTYCSEIREMTLEVQTDDQAELLEKAKAELASRFRPQVSYEVETDDMNVDTHHIGQHVRVLDPHLGLDIITRITRIEYHIDKPWLTHVELSSNLRTLSKYDDRPWGDPNDLTKPVYQRVGMARKKIMIL